MTNVILVKLNNNDYKMETKNADFAYSLAN